MSQIEIVNGSTNRSKRLVFLGVLILALQIGMLFAYGFAGQFAYITTNSLSVNSQANMLGLYFYMSLFAVGLGLMLSYLGKGAALGLGTAIFTIALNSQLSPLLQKFWYSTFVGTFRFPSGTSFNDYNVLVQDPNGVYMSQVYVRATMAMTISYLISNLATIGRMGLFQIFFSLVIYNIMWPIPYFCNLRLFYNDYQGIGTAFDDFGLTYIYTFAGFFGIIYSIFLNRRFRQDNHKAIPNKTSVVFCILGTTIVFCTLPSTALLPFSITSFPSNRYNVGSLNIFFSQISGIISCIGFSLLFGKTRNLNIQSIIISVLCGPAICAQFGALEMNISAFLTVGAFGGLLAAFWTQIVHPRLNSGKIDDLLSLIGGVLLPSFFGGIVVTPILYRIYINNNMNTVAGLGAVNDMSYINHQYEYYFITAGTAALAGIIAGLFAMCSRNMNDDFTIHKIFSPDYGLCNNPVKNIQNQFRQDNRGRDQGQSGEHIRNRQ